jgi:hypothetical protein
MEKPKTSIENLSEVSLSSGREFNQDLLNTQEECDIHAQIGPAVRIPNLLLTAIGSALYSYLLIIFFRCLCFIAYSISTYHFFFCRSLFYSYSLPNVIYAFMISFAF